jgi:hypothetical protein
MILIKRPRGGKDRGEGGNDLTLFCSLSGQERGIDTLKIHQNYTDIDNRCTNDYIT